MVFFFKKNMSKYSYKTLDFLGFDEITASPLKTKSQFCRAHH